MRAARSAADLRAWQGEQSAWRLAGSNARSRWRLCARGGFYGAIGTPARGASRAGRSDFAFGRGGELREVAVPEEVRPCRERRKWIEVRAVECRHCGARLVDAEARGRNEAEAASAAAAAAAAHAVQERRLVAGGAPVPGPRPWSVGVVAVVASIVLGLAIGLTE